MLADRARMTSGGGLPPGAVFLSHMEALPAADIAGGKQLVTIAGSPSITSFKFGNAVRLQGFQQIAVQQPVLLQSTLSSDWTLEFWAKVITNFMNNGSPALLIVYDTAFISVGVLLQRDYANNRYLIAVNLPGLGTIGTSPYQYMYEGDVKFFRLYKKGSEHGLIINGTKYILSGTPTYSNLVGSNTTQSVYSGNNNAGDFAIDEVVLYKDFGNDSLIVPTAPY